MCLYLKSLCLYLAYMCRKYARSHHFECISPDVAKWVLNRQIIRTSAGIIVYKYDLIDDFDSHVCSFAGPIGYLHHRFVKPRGQDQADVAQALNSSANSRYNRVNDSDSVRSTSDQEKPDKYEAYNHMLYLMVSEHHSFVFCGL